MNERMDPQGQRFYQYILRCVPPHAQAEVEAVFRGAMREAGTSNYIAAFLYIIADCAYLGQWTPQ